MDQLVCFPKYSLGGVGGVSYFLTSSSRFTAALVYLWCKTSLGILFEKLSVCANCMKSILGLCAPFVDLVVESCVELSFAQIESVPFLALCFHCTVVLCLYSCYKFSLFPRSLVLSALFLLPSLYPPCVVPFTEPFCHVSSLALRSGFWGGSCLQGLDSYIHVRWLNHRSNQTAWLPNKTFG